MLAMFCAEKLASGKPCQNTKIKLRGRVNSISRSFRMLAMLCAGRLASGNS